MVLIVSSITGIERQDFAKKKKKRTHSEMQGSQEREQTTAADDDEPLVGVDGGELDENVRALPDRLTPGLSFLVVLNIPG